MTIEYSEGKQNIRDHLAPTTNTLHAQEIIDITAGLPPGRRAIELWKHTLKAAGRIKTQATPTDLLNAREEMHTLTAELTRRLLPDTPPAQDQELPKGLPIGIMLAVPIEIELIETLKAENPAEIKKTHKRISGDLFRAEKQLPPAQFNKLLAPTKDAIDSLNTLLNS